MAGRRKSTPPAGTNRIYQLRTERGWTQAELGAKLGVRDEAVHKMESGKTSITEQRMHQLVAIFGVGPEQILISPSPEETFGVWADRVVAGLDTADKDALKAVIDAFVKARTRQAEPAPPPAKHTRRAR
jgi:transcriptional regulator with XRE-family HTH domain